MANFAPAPQGLYDPAQERDSCGVGLIANITGSADHAVVRDAVAVLQRLDHRGACGSDVNSGDGVGVLLATPHEFFQHQARTLFAADVVPGRYAVGLVYLPVEAAARRLAKDVVAELADECGVTLLGWRPVPVSFGRDACAPAAEDAAAATAADGVSSTGPRLGAAAAAGEPHHEQLFVSVSAAKDGGSGEHDDDEDDFERRLYLLRKRAANTFAARWSQQQQQQQQDEQQQRQKNQQQQQQQQQQLYFCSLSSRTVVYKGQLTCGQFRDYFRDLHDPLLKTHVAMVHSRFSTNTFPSWPRAQPNRFTCHNGEINTVGGNKNWMRARQGALSSPLFGPAERLRQLLPIIDADLSDSGAFDCAVEFLVMTGRSLPEVIMMLIPEAWQQQHADGAGPPMSRDKHAFYRYHSALQEPWDGPAMFGFCDGRVAGAVLDRNGLRPARYYVTTDQRLIFGSEVGILDVPDETIAVKGRLEPGKMLLVDFGQGRIVSDDEIKQRVAGARPYADWLKRQEVLLEHIITDANGDDAGKRYDVNALGESFEAYSSPHDPRMRLFNWSTETVHFLVNPMGVYMDEALGSMGNDEALACLSSKPRVIYEYFKQLFAQVTNPPIDPIREGIVMSLECFIGPEGNLCETTEQQCHRLAVKNPVLSPEELEALRHIGQRRPEFRWHSVVIDTTFGRADGPEGLQRAIDRVCGEARRAVLEDGASFLILSDRAAGRERVPMSTLLACGAVHHALVRDSLRCRVGLILETGEAREVHHLCLLLAFGADAIAPYLVYDLFHKLRKDPQTEVAVSQLSPHELVYNYRKAAGKGILKVMAKAGISTLQSYKGAQIFEAVGIGRDVVDKCFTGCSSRLGGVGFLGLGIEALRLHYDAYPPRPTDKGVGGIVTLLNPGDYHWRADGEAHAHEPAAIARLQQATKENSRQQFAEYSKLADRQTQRCMLRGLFKLKYAETPVPLEEVESAASIVKRFVTGAMSYGSISLETHETLAIAMNRIGAKSNTGEGGEDEERYKPLPGGGSKKSAIKQVASARFGVTINYLTNAVELQIKMSQGAKPGEGGELPGYKVAPHIAKVRHSTPGVGLISPPPHHDIYSIEDLKQLIHDLKNANPSARVSVKLVSEVGVGVVAAGCAKAKADHVLISGHDGGTGASKWTSIKHAGLPWELGLAEAHQTLVLNDLRGRVTLQADGGMRTALDVVHAAALGAEEFGFGTVPLVALGCVLMRKCHLNTCPVGIATQDPELRKRFEGQPEYVVNFFFLVAEEVRDHLSRLGLRRLVDLVGRTDLLDYSDERNAKARLLDLTPLLTPASSLRPGVAVTCQQQQDHGLERALDREIIERTRQAVSAGTRIALDLPISSINRTVGTMLSHEIAKQYGEQGLPHDTVRLNFRGSAGQSFGAFLAKGVTLNLTGDANDYVGKGLSGGRIIIRPPPKGMPAGFAPEDNVIIGNVAFYGATSGSAYISGVAAERFCVRNSGCEAVVEGCGDHGLEYMTRGRVIVLGKTGRNFAAGMSGGIAYVYDPLQQFKQRCNQSMVGLETLDGDDRAYVKSKLEKHVRYTGSQIAQRLLGSWNESVALFKKVMPTDLKAVLAEEKKRAVEERQRDIVDEYGPAAVKSNNQDNKSNGFATGAAGAEAAAGAAGMRARSLSIDLERLELPKQAENGAPINDIEDLVPSGAKAKVIGFKTFKRKAEPYREASQRVQDFDEIHTPHNDGDRKRQASRCMDCGVPFCQSDTGCPIGNLIPEWNDLIYKDQWKAALDRLLQTNNFPEFTGRVCPAPCEGACTLGINDDAVTIKNIENAIINRGWEEGWMVPRPPDRRTGKHVAVIGSGPSGLAAADQLNKSGHWVTVYERADRPGGLLVYGIPNMKLDKQTVLRRRLGLMEQEGVAFVNNAHVGVTHNAQEIYDSYDALVLATGATVPRDLSIEGRQLAGVHFAMEFLTAATKNLLDSSPQASPALSAQGKHVITIGGGDTGTDCIATAVRLGCKSLVNFELLDKPPGKRDASNPWPQWPRVFRVEYGHGEAKAKFGEDPRVYNVLTKRFLADESGQRLAALQTVRVKWVRSAKAPGGWTFEEVPGSEQEWPCDMALIAMGFLGPEQSLARQLGVAVDQRTNIKAEHGKFATSLPRVFAAGDCRRGQSLVVWAINEGRGCAKAVDQFLAGPKPYN